MPLLLSRACVSDKERLCRHLRDCRDSKLKLRYLMVVNLINGRSPQQTADTALDMHWQDGKRTLKSRGDVATPDDSRSITSQPDRPGREMVSYARTSGAQIWMFKRTRP